MAPRRPSSASRGWVITAPLWIASSLLIPFVSLVYWDGSVMLAGILMVFSLAAITFQTRPGLVTSDSPLPSPRGGRRHQTKQWLNQCLRDLMTKPKSRIAHQTSLLSCVYLCWGLQLLARMLFNQHLTGVSTASHRSTGVIGMTADSDLIQREMENFLLTWRLENSVESDPLILDMLNTNVTKQIRLPYYSELTFNKPPSGPERPAIGPSPSENGGSGGLSVILPCLNEHNYIVRTVESILQETSPLVLREIIIIDDFNDPPIAEAFLPEGPGSNLNDVIQRRPATADLLNHPKIKLVRNPSREGLIRAKQRGGDMALGNWILFLDAHVKPAPRYLPWLLKDLNANPHRIVVPSIPILDGDTWERSGNGIGYKMMFDWQLRFNWFEDDDDEVPIMSGGLLGMNKSWWNYTQGFDQGMNVWGAENIEQSVKTWMAGGEIVVNRQSLISHYFRPKFPYKVDHSSVTRNKLRVAATWFDRWYKVIQVHVGRVIKETGDLTEAKEVRARISPDRNFNWYIDRFKSSLVKAGLLHLPQFIVTPKEDAANTCLSVEKNALMLRTCDLMRDYWILEGGDPRDVYPNMRINQFNQNQQPWRMTQRLITPTEAAVDASDGQTALTDDLFCEESPVCRKHAALLRNPGSDRCVGAMSKVDAQHAATGLFHAVSATCSRNGSYRDYDKASGFLPSGVRALTAGAPLWDEVVWDRVLPRPQHEFFDGARLVPPNITELHVGEHGYEGQIRWGSMCLDRDSGARPMTSVCIPSKATQQWQFRFVNAPETFWSLTDGRTDG